MVGCRHFSGYKPCGLNDVCSSQCPHLNIPTQRVLLIHLEAMGAVLRSTALLEAIHRKYPGCHLTWLTKKPNPALLANLKHIDQIATFDFENWLNIAGRHFDIVLALDKTRALSGLLSAITFDELYGFKVDSHTGSIVPATAAADELWQIGLSDEKKFFINKKPEIQLATEALELPFQRDPYLLQFSIEEKERVFERRRKWAANSQTIIGFNTGCAGVIPYKKLTVQFHRELVKTLQAKWGNKIKIVLLGGPEDTERNREIAAGLDVIESPTMAGLRDGLVSVAACDIVITGDSLGMHMAIAARKWVIAWFGPTCAHEIDLYDRGVHVLTRATCSPCWKRVCDRTPMCYDQVDPADFESAVEKGMEWLTSSIKQPLSAISY